MQKRLFACCFLLACLAGPAVAKTTFMVFPPENLTRVQTLAWISEGLAIAISEALQVPGVDTFSWEERVRFVEASDLPPGRPLSRGSMIRVAQKAVADRLVFGSYSGTEKNLHIALRVLDLKTLQLSGDIVANGTLSALPQLENELAWVILSDGSRNGALSREEFRARTRTVPNKPYSDFISCLAIANEDERAQMLLKAVELYRDFPQASFLLGAYYFQSGDCARAIQYLKPALKGGQSFLEAEFMLGTCYLKQDNPAEAIQAYSAFVLRGQSPEVLNNLGVAYMRKGDYALAAQNLVEARNLAKTDVTIGLNLAILRHIQGDDTAELAVLDALVKVHPEQGMVQYLHHLALNSRGATERAAAALEQARKLGIDDEKMKRQDPRSWTRIFPSWTRHPTFAWLGEGKLDERSGSSQHH